MATHSRRPREEEASGGAAEPTSLLVDGVRGCALVLLGPDGRIRCFSAGARELTGLSSEEAVGRPLALLYDGDLAGPLAERDLARARQEGHVSVEGWCHRPDGAPLRVRTLVSSTEGPDGELVGYSVVMEPLAGEARAVTQARDEFLTIAAHELKTPLTSTQLHLASLRRRVAGRDGIEPVAAEHHLEVMERQVARLAALVNELLDVSRLAAGRVSLELEEVDLGLLAAEVVGRFEATAAHSGSHITLAVDRRPVRGYWDRMRLDQVLTNLVGNALKYGPGRPVTVEVQAEGEQARITVSDEGIGVAPEDHQRIFERFERAVSDRHYGGFGLGLWVSRKVVAALGGRIEVASERGRGARFTVELPLCARDAA